MKTAVLGKVSPLTVSAVGLGCMGMVSAYPPIPEKKDMVRFAREAFEKGETFFDTAEVYGPYTSEEILGEALAVCGIRCRSQPNSALISKMGFPWGWDSRPETIRKAVEDSLRRLKTDHIDLLYQHRADPKVPVDAVAETGFPPNGGRQGAALGHERGIRPHHPEGTCAAAADSDTE